MLRRLRGTCLSLVAALCLSSAMYAATPGDEPDTPDDWLATGLQIYTHSLDCSHFVHELYSYLGMDYDYLPSIDLYKGTKPFQRVRRPQAGDLIVWRGHVGVVVDAAEKQFLSALNRGLRLSSYDSRYWKRKGVPRFYRMMPEPAVTEPSDGAGSLSIRALEPVSNR